MFLLISNNELEIGWNLPDSCPTGQGSQLPPSQPSAPEQVPNLPRIPIQTTPVNWCGTKVDGAKYNYGCCVPPPAEVASLQDHLLGRPIDSFLAPSQMNATELDKADFWVKGSNGSIPAGAVQGGQEASGEPLFICRAEYNGSLTPGKV